MNETFLINEESKITNTPHNISLKLNKYQQATLYHALNLENNEINECKNNSHIKTKIGVLCSKVGSGKSIILLSILSNNNIYNYDSYCDNLLEKNLFQTFEKINIEIDISSNLLVVPHNLLNQWKQYINDYTDYSYKVISKLNDFYEYFDNDLYEINISNNLIEINNKDEIINKDLNLKRNFIDLLELLKNENNDIILISSTYFNYFNKSIYNFDIQDKLNFNRVIYDEADVLNISNNKLLNANFYWFISSNIDNLICPDPIEKYVRSGEIISDENDQYVRIKQKKTGGILRNGFVKSLFEKLKNVDNKGGIFLKCEDKFIDKYLNLPDIIYNNIRVRNSLVISILKNYLNKELISLINQGDIIGAMNKINCKKENKKNIIDIFTKKMKDELHDLKLYKEYISKKEIINDKENKINDINKQILSKESDIMHIENKIKNINICPISGNEIVNNTYCPNCKNPFEFENLVRWLGIKSSCPLCRCEIKESDLYMESKIETENNQNNESNDYLNIIYNNKYHATINIINKLMKEKDKKILIFSENTESIKMVESLLKDNNHESKILSGNNNILEKIIDKYRNKDLNIILLNSYNYGIGLNLENTTDIIIMHKMSDKYEEQVIGRAQRPGRICELNVWNILFEDEL